MNSLERTLPISIPDISEVSAAFADPTRAAVCGALMSGTAWTPSELAQFCSVSKSTMSEHLAMLKTLKIVDELKQGRHKYFRLAGPEVAEIIESLAAFTNTRFRSPRSLNAVRANRDFIAGRTCYSHLAGKIGVSLLQQLNTLGHMKPNYMLTCSGQRLLTQWGIKNPERLKGKPCLDTTQRVFHLAGPLGSAICCQWLTHNWLKRKEKSRCVVITAAGKEALKADGLFFND